MLITKSSLAHLIKVSFALKIYLISSKATKHVFSHQTWESMHIFWLLSGTRKAIPKQFGAQSEDSQRDIFSLLLQVEYFFFFFNVKSILISIATSIYMTYTRPSIIILLNYVTFL